MIERNFGVTEPTYKTKYFKELIFDLQRFDGDDEGHQPHSQGGAGVVVPYERFLERLDKDTDGKTYLIKTAEKLQALATYVESGYDFAGLTFKLYNDIDLSSIPNFIAIGKSSKQFKGTFDGNGKTIKNLKINSTEDNQGLFGVVGEGGTVKNVLLENANVTGKDNVGAVVGYNNGGTVTDAYYCDCNCNDANATEVFKSDLPSGFTATLESGETVTLGEKTYYKSGAKFTVSPTSGEFNISSADDLKKIDKFCKNFGSTFSGITLNLTADIELPDGCDLSNFAGTINGNGKFLTNVNNTIGGTVKNLKYYGTATLSGSNLTRYYKITLPEGATVTGATVERLAAISTLLKVLKLQLRRLKAVH